MLKILAVLLAFSLGGCSTVNGANFASLSGSQYFAAEEGAGSGGLFADEEAKKPRFSKAVLIGGAVVLVLVLALAAGSSGSGGGIGGGY